MARPSKLTVSQCARIRALKTDPTDPVPAPVLAKRFKVSESSIYKVLDGSYVAREDDPHKGKPTVALTNAPAVPAGKPAGAMPSLFADPARDNGNRQETPRRRASDYAPVLQPTLAQLLERAAKADCQEPVDDVTLAAAELVMARAKLSKALAQQT